jgi:hypothetical protein
VKTVTFLDDVDKRKKDSSSSRRKSSRKKKDPKTKKKQKDLDSDAPTTGREEQPSGFGQEVSEPSASGSPSGSAGALAVAPSPSSTLAGAGKSNADAAAQSLAVAVVPERPLTPQDPSWNAPQEREKRARKMLKTAKKASRAMNKMNRGTKKKQKPPEKPLELMTLKEIIQRSNEADRTESRRRPRGEGNTSGRDGGGDGKGKGHASAQQNGGGEEEAPAAEKGANAIVAHGSLYPKSSGSDASKSKETIAPQVQIVDGQIVINQESLSVKAQVEPIMKPERRIEESGNKLSAFSYSGYLTPEKWSVKDTETFFKALQQFGTDFGLIQKLFPKRQRKQIKSKFRREEKKNPDRIEDALKKHGSNESADNFRDILNLLMKTAEAEGV